MMQPIYLRETIGRGIVRALSSQFSGLPQAILELIDNPIDYREDQHLRIDLVFDRQARTIRIYSQGGRGMDTTDFDRFVSWGDSRHHVAGDIGAYGQGGKAAIAYLGNAFRIWGKRRDSDQVFLLEDAGWRTRTELRDFGILEPVPHETEPRELQMSTRAEGAVMIEILDCDMNRRWNLNVLRRQIGSVYRSLIIRKVLSVHVNGEAVKPTQIELDSSAPNILLGFSKGGVAATGWAGRLDRRRSDDGVKSGVRIYSNGRLIVDGEWFGFNWTGKGSYNHLIGELDVSGLTPNLNKSAFVEGDDEIWEHLGKAVLKQMQPLLVALRSSADQRQVTAHERAAASAVRDELASTLRQLSAEMRKSPEGTDELPRGRRRRRKRKAAPEDEPKETTATGRTNEPRTPAPEDAVGRLRRTASRIKGVPKVEIDSWDPTVRSVITDEAGKRVMRINASYPMYRLSDASKPYLAETILLELLQADPDVASKQDLLIQLDVLLRRWSERHLDPPEEPSRAKTKNR